MQYTFVDMPVDVPTANQYDQTFRTVEIRPSIKRMLHFVNFGGKVSDDGQIFSYGAVKLDYDRLDTLTESEVYTEQRAIIESQQYKNRKLLQALVTQRLLQLELSYKGASFYQEASAQLYEDFAYFSDPALKDTDIEEIIDKRLGDYNAALKAITFYAQSTYTHTEWSGQHARDYRYFQARILGLLEYRSYLRSTTHPMYQRGVVCAEIETLAKKINEKDSAQTLPLPATTQAMPQQNPNINYWHSAHTSQKALEAEIRAPAEHAQNLKEYIQFTLTQKYRDKPDESTYNSTTHNQYCAGLIEACNAQDATVESMSHHLLSVAKSIAKGILNFLRSRLYRDCHRIVKPSVFNNLPKLEMGRDKTVALAQDFRKIIENPEHQTHSIRGQARAQLLAVIDRLEETDDEAEALACMRELYIRVNAVFYAIGNKMRLSDRTSSRMLCDMWRIERIINDVYQLGVPVQFPKEFEKLLAKIKPDQITRSEVQYAEVAVIELKRDATQNSLLDEAQAKYKRFFELQQAHEDDLYAEKASIALPQAPSSSTWSCLFGSRAQIGTRYKPLSDTELYDDAASTDGDTDSERANDQGNPGSFIKPL